MSTSSERSASGAVTTEPAPGATTTSPQRAVLRRQRKRLRTMPPPPLPMRARWEGASAAQQKEAYEKTVWMLEYWLGRMSKQEAAAAMSVTPLRVWQLSQMALAGMVCGLLPQPRYRKGMAVSTSDPESDPKVLRRRIAKLESELASAQRLIDLLKTLPGNATRQLHEPGGTAGAASAGGKEPGPPSRRARSSGARPGRGRRS